MDVAIARRAGVAGHAHGGGVAAGGGDGHIVGVERGHQGGGREVAPRRGHGEVVGVEQPGARLALRRRGVNVRSVVDLQIRRRSLNKPPVAPQAAALGADGACHFGDAVGVAQVGNHFNAPALPRAARRCVGADAAGKLYAVAGHQAHHAAVVHQAGGADHTGVFHHPGLQAARSLGRQDDEATGRLHRVAVFHQRSNGGRGHQHVGQVAVAAQLQLVALARRQGHGAHLGDDQALVAHLGGQQGDVAAVLRAQSAFVDHAAGGAAALKLQLARHEVGVSNAVGGSTQCAHVHAGAGGKVDAAGVGQKHLAVGVDLAVNLARRAAQHAVQDNAAGLGLVEVDFGSRSHVKALPVHHRAVGGLHDIHDRAALANARRACHHLSTLRQLGGRRATRVRQPRAHQCGYQRLEHRPRNIAQHRRQAAAHSGSRGACAPCFGGLGHSDIAA